MLTSKFMKKLHTIYYLSGKSADGAGYVDCILREGNSLQKVGKFEGKEHYNGHKSKHPGF